MMQYTDTCLLYTSKPYPALLAELLSKELYSLRQQKSLTQEARRRRQTRDRKSVV